MPEAGGSPEEQLARLGERGAGRLLEGVVLKGGHETKGLSPGVSRVAPASSINTL